VQTIIPLGPNNGALRLTTARYYTPSGRSIQAERITPDITVSEQVPENLESQSAAISEAALRRHLKASGPEQKGSQIYAPADPKDDKAFNGARLVAGFGNKPGFPPRPQAACREMSGQPPAIILMVEVVRPFTFKPVAERNDFWRLCRFSPSAFGGAGRSRLSPAR
jgi:hypothetical protein